MEGKQNQQETCSAEMGARLSRDNRNLWGLV